MLKTSFQRSSLAIAFLCVFVAVTVRAQSSCSNVVGRSSANITAAGEHFGGGMLKSDADGSGPLPYGSRDNCVWTLRCPAGAMLRVSALSGTLSSSALLQYRPTNANDWNRFDSSTSLDEQLDRVSQLKASSILVRFENDGATGAGFDLTWECQSSLCPASPTSGTVTNNGSTHTTLKSDADGELSVVQTATDASCEWLLKCEDPSQSVYIVDLKGALRVGSVLKFSDGRGGWTSLNGTLDEVSSWTNRFDEMRVVYDGFGTGSAAGFMLNWTCNVPTCSAALTPPVEYQNGGWIRSDRDGEGSFPHQANDDCTWTLSCPLPDSVIVFREVRGLTAAGSRLFTEALQGVLGHQFHELTAGEPSGNLSALSNWTDYSLESDTRKLQFIASGAQGADGFALRWECVQKTCSAATATPQGVHTGGGRIMSDSDGVGSNPSGQNQKCKWTLQCPEGHVVAIDDGSVLESINADDDERFSIIFRGRSYSSPNTGGWISSGADPILNVTLETNMHPGNGFTLDWKCVPMTCKGSPTAEGSFSGGGLLDYWQSGPGKLGNLNYCQWDLHCAANEVLWYTKVATLSSPDKLELLQPGTNLNSDPYGWYQANRSSLHVVLRSWNGSDTMGSLGFRLTWGCSVPTCSSTTPQLSYTNETNKYIASDTDGDGSAVAAFGEECTWNLTCPEGNNLFVGPAVGEVINDFRGLRFYNASSARRVGQSFRSGSVQWYKIVYEVQSVRAVFMQEKDTSKTKANGFNFSWGCQPKETA